MDPIKKMVNFVVQRSSISPDNTPCCGGNYQPYAPEHAEPGGEIYACCSCGGYFAVVDDCYPIGSLVTFRQIPGHATPGLTLLVMEHPFN